MVDVTGDRTMEGWRPPLEVGQGDGIYWDRDGQDGIRTFSLSLILESFARAWF